MRQDESSLGLPACAAPVKATSTTTATNDSFFSKLAHTCKLKTAKGRWNKGRLTALCTMMVVVMCFVMLRTIHTISLLPNACLKKQTNTVRAVEEFHDRIRFRGTNRRLPTCVIIGVRKCGTRALLEFMNMHPKIQAAHGEVHFFDSDHYELGLDWYRKRMPYSFPGQITIEKSPAYFITEGVPERIYKMNNQTKLLLIVRDPVERAVSDYTQIHTNRMLKGKPHEPFERLAIDEYGEVNTSYKAIRIGLYYKHLQRWVDVFPREQLLVVNGNQLIHDPVSVISEIEKFLGLEPFIKPENFYFNETKGFYCLRHDLTERCLSETKGRKHPNIDPKIRKKLEDFYRPMNQKFYQMVGHEFGWPWPSNYDLWLGRFSSFLYLSFAGKGTFLTVLLYHPELLYLPLLTC